MSLSDEQSASAVRDPYAITAGICIGDGNPPMGRVRGALVESGNTSRSIRPRCDGIRYRLAATGPSNRRNDGRRSFRGSTR